MRRMRWLSGAVVLLALGAGMAQAQTYIWTGLDGGWRDQVGPVSNGTADLVFSDRWLHDTVYFGTDFDLNSVNLAGDDSIYFTYASGATLPLQLTVRSGGTISGGGSLVLDPNVDVVLTGTPVFNAGDGRFVVPGHINGDPSNVTLMSSGAVVGGAFIFNNTDTGNAYTGTTTLYGTSGLAVTVAFWNNSPFSTGAVNVTGATALVAHGTQTITNNFTFSSADTSSFRSWDAPLTFSGGMTLASSLVTFQALPAPAGVAAPDNQGSWLTPGQASRNPTVFAGVIGETGGARTLRIGGAGVVILQPTGPNTYTGGTIVNGSAIFANADAIPATGVITVNSSGGANGYAGIADTTPGNFASFLAKVATTSDGAVGVDTLPGDPTTILSDNINLSGFSNANIRLGTATTAILTGAITPKDLTQYRFGNGGGSLYIQANLPNRSTTTQLVLQSNLDVGTVSPLKLYLQGLQNPTSYSGGTTAYNGFIIFDSTIPASGQLTAAGSSTTNGASYIGQTDASGVTAFLAAFNKANTWGIIGFDQAPSASEPALFNQQPVDLTNFHDGVYLGTSSQAYLTTSITPANNTYYFTAGNGGHLGVSSQLTGNRSVVIGSPSSAYAYSDGVVTLDSNNNDYTGGTIINTYGPITLEVAGTSPLGTGPLTFPALGGAPVGLSAASAGYTLANNIVFPTVAADNPVTQLYLSGEDNFTLSGQISGPGQVNMLTPSRTYTLSGDNQAWSGGLSVVTGTINLAHNHAAGTGQLNLMGPAATVAFSGSATAPVLHGISGREGHLIVPDATILTFDTSSDLIEHDFGGVISAAGGGMSTASLVVDSSTGSDALYLHGDNKYSGGTTIINAGVFALGHDGAAGTGAVTVSATSGGLAINSGVTFTNALNFTSGGLAGYGTFAPSNLTTVTFGANRFVAPGLPNLADFPAGTLTFDTNVAFGNGGRYNWSLQDATRTEGSSLLVVNGDLDLTALSAGGFQLKLMTFDAHADPGFSPLAYGQNYTFILVNATGSVLGFNAANFSFDVTEFQNGGVPLSAFSVTADAQHLYLNFQAVPEPPVWTLLAAGLALGAWARRRR